MKKKKIYYAKETIEVVFVSNYELNTKLLRHDASKFISEESKNCHEGKLSIIEVKSINDIPKEWYRSLIWGTPDDVDMTAVEYLEDPEYKVYLKLKEKFDPESSNKSEFTFR